MSRIQIKDGTLTLTITDPRQVVALAALDTNRNGVVEPEDAPPKWGGAPRSSAEFRDAVTATLGRAGAFHEESQQLGFRKFLDVYPTIQAFDQLTDQWYQHKTSTEDGELEFGAEYWRAAVLPHITGDGEFTPDRISQMSVDLYTAMFDLADAPGARKPGYLPSRRMECDRTYIASILFFSGEVSAFVKPALLEALTTYSRSIKWLAQYYDIECEGDGCGAIDEVSIGAITLLPPLQEDTGAPLTPAHAAASRHRWRTTVLDMPGPTWGLQQATGGCSHL